MDDSAPQWRVVFFRVGDLDRQQRILAAFAHLDRPSTRVLGTRDGGACLVAVECETVAAEITARRVIRAIDHGAVEVHRAGRRRTAVARAGSTPSRGA